MTDKLTGWLTRTVHAALEWVIDWSGALYFYRVPLALAGALVLLFKFRGSAMISGLFAAPTWSGFGVAFGVTALAGEILSLMTLLQLHGPERLAMPLPHALDKG